MNPAADEAAAAGPGTNQVQSTSEWRPKTIIHSASAVTACAPRPTRVAGGGAAAARSRTAGREPGRQQRQRGGQAHQAEVSQRLGEEAVRVPRPTGGLR